MKTADDIVVSFLELMPSVIEADGRYHFFHKNITIIIHQIGGTQKHFCWINSEYFDITAHTMMIMKDYIRKNSKISLDDLDKILQKDIRKNKLKKLK